jgi:hypothetical protein
VRRVRRHEEGLRTHCPVSSTAGELHRARRAQPHGDTLRSFATERFRHAIESGDIEGAIATLAAYVVFQSPAVFKPYVGRDAVGMILRCGSPDLPPSDMGPRGGAEGQAGDHSGHTHEAPLSANSVVQLHVTGPQYVPSCVVVTTHPSGYLGLPAVDSHGPQLSASGAAASHAYSGTLGGWGQPESLPEPDPAPDPDPDPDAASLPPCVATVPPQAHANRVST